VDTGAQLYCFKKILKKTNNNNNNKIIVIIIKKRKAWSSGQTSNPVVLGSDAALATR